MHDTERKRAGASEREGGAAIVYDEADALRRAGGDANLLRLLNEELLAQLGPALAEIRSALARSDGGALRAGAHQLRGALMQTGLPAAARVASELELRGVRADFSEARALMTELEAECDRAQEALRVTLAAREVGPGRPRRADCKQGGGSK
jgi:HPt (histidine-containing phosphotransfer) domain-containing protein